MITHIDPEIKQPRLDLIDGIVYSKVPAPLKGCDVELKMMLMKDSFIGGGKKTEKKPCILWLMGGAWRSCPREKCIPFLVYFARRGYVVASAEYRVSGEALWPAQIIDVRTAVRYLRTNADKMGIDPDKIAVMGLSAGGHLTAMAAMNPQEYESEEWSGVSGDVQAAIDMFGPAEISKLSEQLAASPYKPAFAPRPGTQPMHDALIGGTPAEKPVEFADANPAAHISGRSAPLLILHGAVDAVVPVQQSIGLHDALNAAGRPTDLYILENSGHGAYQFFQESVKEIMISFLDKYLK